MEHSVPSWVVEAARLPLAFAQVREDPLLDLWVVQQIGAGASVIMVASGGCTAAALAASGLVSLLHVVDPNPAQVALTRLKLRLLQAADPCRRLALLGHASFPVEQLATLVGEHLQALALPLDVLGPRELWSKPGLDHAGRYERLFARLCAALGPWDDELVALLRLGDPREQAARVAPTTGLGRALDVALDEVMALPNLIALFGEGATRNRHEPFARHFARRTRHALATLPAATNPYLWQMYRGCFPERVAYPWFTAAAPARMPEITWSVTVMTAALREAAHSFDFVHLSNILDWLSPDEARTTLDLAASALRPAGWVLIRQLNSTLEIPSLSSAFTWQTDEAERLHARDRSFFYRGLHLGRKR